MAVLAWAFDPGTAPHLASHNVSQTGDTSGAIVVICQKYLRHYATASGLWRLIMAEQSDSTSSMTRASTVHQEADARALRTAVVGVGFFGTSHARIHSELSGPKAVLVAVCDIDQHARQSVASSLGVAAVGDWHDLIGNVDAVSIAVPTASHHAIAVGLLDAGVHVLVEKPIAASVAEAAAMVNAAAASGAVLQVGHLERFNPAIRALKERLRIPFYVDVYREGGLSRRNAHDDVVLDLMIHDLEILQWLFDDSAEVLSIDAVGGTMGSDTIDFANARMLLSSGLTANLTASRIRSDKARRLRVFQPDGAWSLDFAAQTLEWMYRPGEWRSRPPETRIAIDAVPLEHCEPLREEIKSFLAACGGSVLPEVTGQQGLTALSLALAVRSVIEAELRQAFRRAPLEAAGDDP